MKVFISPQKKIGYFFLIFTLILLGSTIFALFSVNQQVEISIKPKTFDIETNFTLPVNSKNWPEIKLWQKTKQVEKEFSPKTVVTIEDYAQGEIKIINKSRRAQRLIATTRFLSASGLLFRLVDQVYIKAGGETKAIIKADKPGKKYELGPTKFSIPGLPKYLQKLIYAENEKPLTGSSRQSGLVLRSDLEEAKKNLKEQLYSVILDKIKRDLPEKNLQIITRSEILTAKSDTQENEEKERFKFQLELQVQALAIDKQKLLSIAHDNLAKKIKEGQKIVSYEDNSLSCIIDGFDFGKKQAELKVGLRGQTTINEKSEIFDKEKIKKLSAKEIKEYLESQEEIDQVKIKFWPAFYKKIPMNIDKIKIKIL